MFYVSSCERCSERIVWQRSVGILYQDTVSSHTNSESNLRIGNGRCRESKVPRMYANSHKLGIVVVLTRSSSSRSRCDWTDCWRDSVSTDEIGILDFRMSKHSANPLTDQFWNLPNPLWRIAGNVLERRKMENRNKRQFYDISRLGYLIIKYSFIFASREDLSLLEKLFKWTFFLLLLFCYRIILRMLYSSFSLINRTLLFRYLHYYLANLIFKKNWDTKHFRYYIFHDNFFHLFYNMIFILHLICFHNFDYLYFLSSCF